MGSDGVGMVAFTAFGIGVQDQSKAGLPQCQIDADYLGLQYLPKLFSKIVGKPYDPSKNKLCYFDNTVQPSGKTRSTEWAESLASVDGDTITITHLKPWSENVVVKPVDGGTTIANMGWLEEVVDSRTAKIVRCSMIAVPQLLPHRA